MNDATQVDVSAVSFARADDILVGRRMAQSGHDLVAHLEAARFDVRSDGGDDVEAAGDELVKGTDGRCHDVACGAAPSAVHGGHGAGYAVGEQNGSTVGHAHRARDTGIARQHDIALRASNCGDVEARIDRSRRGSMNLAEVADALRGDTELASRPSQILRNSARIVAHGHGKVQGGKTPLAHASFACEEGMSKSGVRQQRRDYDHGGRGRDVTQESSQGATRASPMRGSRSVGDCCSRCLGVPDNLSRVW